MSADVDGDWRKLPLPAIDSSSMATWAKTWVDQLQWAVDHVNSGALPLHYGGDYASYAADLSIGDAPWDPASQDEFYALQQADPRWAALQPVLERWYASIFDKPVLDIGRPRGAV